MNRPGNKGFLYSRCIKRADSVIWGFSLKYSVPNPRCITLAYQIALPHASLFRVLCLLHPACYVSHSASRLLPPVFCTAHRAPPPRLTFAAYCPLLAAHLSSPSPLRTERTSRAAGRMFALRCVHHSLLVFAYSRPHVSIPSLSSPSLLIRRGDTNGVKASRNYKFTPLNSLPPVPSLALQTTFANGAAERCIGIPELADLIISNFNRSYIEPCHRTELLNIMLVCKALFYPACAVLWRQLDTGLLPLFDILDLIDIDPVLLRALQLNPIKEYVALFLRSIVGALLINEPERSLPWRTP